jgi:hypothetical protein
MQYLVLIYDEPGQRANIPPEAMAAVMPKFMAYSDMLRGRNAYVAAAPLAEPSSTTTLRIRDGKRLVTDGPFAETKEWLGGFYLIECASLDEALDLAAKCPAAEMGSTLEVRPIIDM